MKTLLFTLALATGFTVQAQWHSNPSVSADEAATQRTEVMVKSLNLNADQQARVAHINQVYARGMRDVNTIPDETARQGRANALNQQREQAFEQLFTEEQYVAWQKERE